VRDIDAPVVGPEACKAWVPVYGWGVRCAGFPKAGFGVFPNAGFGVFPNAGFGVFPNAGFGVFPYAGFGVMPNGDPPPAG
jgi:hypothetical protein